MANITYTLIPGILQSAGIFLIGNDEEIVAIRKLPYNKRFFDAIRETALDIMREEDIAMDLLDGVQAEMLTAFGIPRHLWPI